MRFFNITIPSKSNFDNIEDDFKYCKTCKDLRDYVYVYKYDCHACPVCLTYIGTKCRDKKCEYCVPRPEKMIVDELQPHEYAEYKEFVNVQYVLEDEQELFLDELEEKILF